ncbi:flavin-binding monooxygenase-like protein [Phlyctema vagabunda]|uniref:Flavin-binding monooxygenase-like protein n=1 Tax=Phlyctema vagabunda TaxID=108571 RepID=A0ABR4PLM3_9HELO
MDEYDLVIVGAGIFGLPVAKTYLEVSPYSKVLVLDANKSIGGTWSAERMYDELRSNNLVGMLEYSDFPMDFETFGVASGSHIPGPIIHTYLKAYAKKFGVYERIRFRSWVQSAELLDDGNWSIIYREEDDQGSTKEVKLLAKKLVLATGTTTMPVMPNFVGGQTFNGHIFHFRDLPIRTEEMAAAKNIVVLGGSKSAADVAYLNAVRGRHVDWVIRASGRGPGWLATAFVSPLKTQFEKLATRRILSFLNPCLEDDGYHWIRRLFHNTRIGRAFLGFLFGVILNDLIECGKYNDHPDTKKLIPHNNIYWSGTTVGIFNYPEDFFGMVRKGQISVHIEDIDSLSHQKVHLANGTDLEADVLVCATGWEHTPTVRMLPEKISNSIGIFTATPSDSMVKAADEEVFRRFPELADQPSVGPVAARERDQTSWALYRGTAPPAFLESRNLAYCGMSTSLRGCLVAEITALWITALFDGKLSAPLPSQGEAEWQALVQNRFYRWRAPMGLGSKSTDMVFETLPFVDTMLRDLGLNTVRKGGWREIFDCYGVKDYIGIVQEWLTKERKSES